MSFDHHKVGDPCDVGDLEPTRPDNRPNLDEIAYRIGVHSAFLKRMFWRLPRTEVHDAGKDVLLRPLEALRVRGPEDPSIALLDAWAASLDVLSFYSERAANEGYLRTATERRSMVELARSLGYELAPGVAASVYLAFTVEDRDDPFRTVDVPVGLPAMSVPQEKGDIPQVFETLEPILARAEWNAMPAQTERSQNLAIYHDPEDNWHGRLVLIDTDNSFDLEAMATENYRVIETAADAAPYYPLSSDLDMPAALADLQADQALNPEIEATLSAVHVSEAYLRGLSLNLSKGDRLLLVGARMIGDDNAMQEDRVQEVATTAMRVVETETLTDYQLTRVELARIVETSLVRKAFPPRSDGKFKFGSVTSQKFALSTNSFQASIGSAVWSGDALSAHIETQGWSVSDVLLTSKAPPTLPPLKLGSAVPGFYVLRETVGFFGNTAPRWETLASPDNTRGADPYSSSWDVAPLRSIWEDSQGVDHASGEGAKVYLEREVDKLAPDGWAVFENPGGETLPVWIATVASESRTDFALTGKSTALTLNSPSGDPFMLDEATPSFDFRTARAHLRSDFLPLAGAPVLENVEEGATELSLNGLYLNLERGRSVSIQAERADARGLIASEAIAIHDITHIGGATRITLASGVSHPYLRATLRINANVALASHGETFEETLGSGDATRANQAFRLAKPPLTFVSTANETGRASTLTVRVDGVAWREVSSLFFAGPDDEVYQVRLDDDGAVRVVFGDGVKGRRLPTGTLNVVASYRSGIGAVGEVPDEAVIQLKTRPLGVREVVNPSPASGSAEPETVDTARRNAPQSVRVLGRIVSLTDYEDFARAFAGIGKARATALWSGRVRLAHLTVTPETDSLFDANAKTFTDLVAAIEAVRNPGPPVVVAPYRRRLFRLTARLGFDSRYLAEDVEAATRARLSEVFSYDARDLGQPVSAAEVLSVLQTIDGVQSVDLDELQRYAEEAAELDAPETANSPGAILANILPAASARVTESLADLSQIPAAELLTLLDAGVKLTMEAVDV